VNIRLPGKGWRNRIGEEGVEWLLTETIKARQRAGTVQDGHLKKVTVDSEAGQETTWGVVSPANGDGEEHRAPDPSR
jgi:hypothetical protein